MNKTKRIYNNESELPDIMTAADISAFMHISKGKVYNLMNADTDSGGIKVKQIGRTKRVRKIDFIEWMNSDIA